MDIDFSRQLDKYGGALLCSLLRMRNLLPAAKDDDWKVGINKPPERILIIKFFGLGNILRMYSMIESLKRKYPKAKITLLTFAQNKQLLRLLPLVDDAEFIEFRNGLARFVAQTLGSIRTLRGKKFDLVFNCEFFSNFSALMVQAVRSPQAATVGFFNNRWCKDWIYTHQVSIDGSQHVSKIFARMLLPFGVGNDAVRSLETCCITVPESSRIRMDSVLQDLGIEHGSRLVTININASNLCYNRRWPAAHFGKLLEMILCDPRGRDGIYFLLVGGTEDRSYVKGFMERFAHPNIHNLAGLIDLTELAALLSKSTLFIGNDSGPLHLAVFCGVRSVSFFGPETPRFYGPLGDAHHVFYADLHCSPCLNIYFSKQNDCRDNVCLKSITPEAVLPRVLEMLFTDQETDRGVT